MHFEFSTADRILFGPGSLGQIDRLATDLGYRVLVVTGRSSKRAEPLDKAVGEA